MADQLTREQALAGCNDKDLREAFRRALDDGWTASRTGSGRFKFTHPQAVDSVFAPGHVGSNNSIANFEARLARAIAMTEVPPEDEALREVHFTWGNGVLPEAKDAEMVKRFERWMDDFDVHQGHSHYEDMSTAKLRKHLNERHNFKKYFGIKIDASLPTEALLDIHNVIHGGEAIKERPKPPERKKPKTDTRAASTEKPVPSTEKSEPSDEQEERSMGEVVAMKDADEGDGESTDRHFGTLQRAVLAVLHEFPGVAMTVEECADLCVDDLDVPQVGGALWRCSRIGGLRVTRVSKGVYRYDPPVGAPNLAVIDRDRTGTPTPPAKPRPGVDDPERPSDVHVTVPPSEAPIRVTGHGGAGHSVPVGPDDILFEVVLRAEDGSLVLRASDGTVWNAKKI